MDDAFKALGDPTRRLLLDRLFERDGRTLGDLCEGLAMTRFGAMKHLRILEAAGLITARRVGREKRHFLNPVPIQLIHDRWVSKYAEPWARALGGLKKRLEETTVETTPKHVYEVYIRTTPERLWQALTDPEITRDYWYGALNRSTWQPGAPWTSESETGEVYLDGEIIEADPPRRLVHTFHVVHEAGAAHEAPSRLTFEITPAGEVCKLTVVHEGMAEATQKYVEGGWTYILSGLKTLLETGRPLNIPEPVAS